MRFFVYFLSLLELTIIEDRMREDLSAFSPRSINSCFMMAELDWKFKIRGFFQGKKMVASTFDKGATAASYFIQLCDDRGD